MEREYSVLSSQVKGNTYFVVRLLELRINPWKLTDYLPWYRGRFGLYKNHPKVFVLVEVRCDTLSVGRTKDH